MTGDPAQQPPAVETPGHVTPAKPPPREAPGGPWSKTGLVIHAACGFAVVAGLMAGVWWPVVTAFVIETLLHVAKRA